MKHSWPQSLACLWLALICGCAGMDVPKVITNNDVAPKLKQRNEEAVRSFERQRDAAEFEAARNRWLHQNDPKGCREVLERLLARNPQHRDARLLLADLLLTENDAPAAYTHAKKALDEWPNDPQVQYTMATVLDALGRTSDALGYYERASKMAPSNEAYRAAYESAREAAHEIVNQTGYDAGERGNLSSAGYNEADGSAAQLSEMDNLLLSGERALAQGDLQAAKDYFLRAIALEADNPKVPLLAGTASLRANKPELAIELLSVATEKFPKDAKIHRALAVAFYRRGDYTAAYSALQQALSVDKSDALSYFLMGCTLAKLGRREAAEPYLRQAHALDAKYGFVR